MTRIKFELSEPYNRPHARLGIIVGMRVRNCEAEKLLYEALRSLTPHHIFIGRVASETVVRLIRFASKRLKEEFIDRGDCHSVEKNVRVLILKKNALVND